MLYTQTLAVQAPEKVAPMDAHRALIEPRDHNYCLWWLRNLIFRWLVLS